MGARYLALVVVPVVLTGCAELITPVAHSSRPTPTTVRITVASRDVHGTVGSRDTIRFVRISGPATVVSKELEPDGVTEVHLPGPGTYTLASWTRSCARTCSTLRQARHRCSASYTTATGVVSDVEIRSRRSGERCTVAVSDPT
jgi:hypothetical protein